MRKQFKRGHRAVKAQCSRLVEFFERKWRIWQKTNALWAQIESQGKSWDAPDCRPTKKSVRDYIALTDGFPTMNSAEQIIAMTGFLQLGYGGRTSPGEDIVFKTPDTTMKNVKRRSQFLDVRDDIKASFGDLERQQRPMKPGPDSYTFPLNGEERKPLPPRSALWRNPVKLTTDEKNAVALAKALGLPLPDKLAKKVKEAAKPDGRVYFDEKGRMKKVKAA